LKTFSKFGVLLVGALWVIAGAPEVFAFSVGGFQVQSKFGEKFSASFEINLDFEGPVEVILGNEEDYNKLGLNRQDIMDALVIDPIEPRGGLEKTIQIRSNKPLFFPSFNLIVRAIHNGGTLLENFLVTVDFQQSLALNVRRNKENAAKLSNNEPEPLADQEIPSRPAKTQPLKKPGSGKDSVQEPVLAAEPDNSSKVQTPKARQEESKTVGSPVEAERAPPLAIVPIPAKEQVAHRRRASGVIWANPRPIPKWIASVPARKPVAKTKLAGTGSSALVGKKDPDTPQILSPVNEGYVLQKGEGLFSIAKKLKIDNYHPAQIAVAIWMQNIDKFIFGNINGIQAGVKLDLENLAGTLTDIDPSTARKILNSQTVEWNLAKNTTRVKAETPEKSISEIPLPSERLENHAALFKQVIGWQTTWENMDIEGHLAYYQNSKVENPFKVKKKNFLSRYPKPHLETSSKMLVMKEGVPLVFFEQDFSSETMKSRGLKELEWTRSQSAWKIRGENFYEILSQSTPEALAKSGDLDKPVNEEKGIKLSFVIHVSSHANESLAVALTNQLRGNGFDAYWAPVRISREIQIYRVYIGRFSDWNQAHRVVRILRKKSFAGHATAIPYPFALEVGKVSSITEARMLLESLRKSGLSGLLLASHKEPAGLHLRVVVGAFKKADNATWILQRLKQSGFVGTLISP
jgi:cell division septation protein DedD